MKINSILFIRNQCNQLILVKEQEEVEVKVSLCFPWSYQDKFISLHDHKGYEHLLIEDLTHLPNEAQVIIKEELQKKYFLPHILSIFTLKEEKGLFAWHVNTTVGERIFFTKRQEQFRTLKNGGIILHDIENDFYFIPNPHSLDSKSYELLWVYLD